MTTENFDKNQRSNSNQQGDASKGGKDPSRVESGRKTAETRGNRNVSEAGKKGGQHSQSGNA